MVVPVPSFDWSIMATLEFFIPTNRTTKSGRPAPLDGLNELVASERKGFGAGNSLKRKNGLNAQQFCEVAMIEQGWKCPDCRCHVTLTFIEPSERRDPDNVYGGTKFILDGITKPIGRKTYGAGAIEDDSQKWIDLSFGPILVDKDHVGCLVRIETL